MNDNGRTWRIVVRIAGAFFIFLALLVVLWIGYSIYLRKTFEANIRTIRVGDTKERVETLLGAADHRFAKGTQLIDEVRKQSLLVWLVTSETPETWVYGGPRLIWFGPSKHDFVIEFDNEGKVSRVVIPTER